jgi:hypothetical protein
MKCADNPHAQPSKKRTLWRFSDFAARERGATKEEIEEEIAEALGVAVSVNTGAAIVYTFMSASLTTARYLTPGGALPGNRLRILCINRAAPASLFRARAWTWRINASQRVIISSLPSISIATCSFATL